MEGSESGVDVVEEVGVDGAEASLFYVGFGAAGAEVEGFVGADVEEGTGKVSGDLSEPALDEGKRGGLAGGDDVAVRGFGDVGIFLIEDVVDVAEGFLLGNDDDVEGGGEGYELAGLGAGEGAAGRRGEGSAEYSRLLSK